MLLRLLFALPILFAVPGLKMQWTGDERESVTIHLDGQEDFFDACLQSGFQLEYRFQIQICKRRPVWFDACKNDRIEKHTISFDAISQTYRMRSDRHGDTVGPATEILSSKEEASERQRTVREIPLMFLAHDDIDYVQSRRSYVSVRVKSSCLGEYNETFENISYVLTLGLVRLGGFDSGWVDFALHRDNE